MPATIALGLVTLCLILWSGFVQGQDLNYGSMLTRGIEDLQTLHQIQHTLANVDLFSILKKQFSKENGYFLLKGEDIPISDKCLNTTYLFLEALQREDAWTTWVLDSFGKPKPGILLKTFLWEGLYEECINVTHPLLPMSSENDTEANESMVFQGRYCSAVMSFGGPPPMPGNPIHVNRLNLGVCIPDTCNSDEMVYILNAALDSVNVTNSTYRFDNKSSTCQKESLKLDDKAQGALVVTAIFVLLLFIGTLYDCIIVQMPKWNRPRSARDGMRQDKLDTGDTGINTEHEVIDELRDTKTSMELDIPEPDIFGRLLVSFSVYSNGRKILGTKQRTGNLNAVHGIRFLSMTWVILGHTFIFGNGVIENVFTYYPPLLKNFAFQAVMSAHVAVDTFFVLSGLLGSYLTLKELKRKCGKINWFMFYFHRYWRLTPPYMMIMLLYVPLFPYLSNGPFWPQKGVEINECRNTWWTNLIYVNNLVKKEEQCMGWTWYLANDMQFYIISPLLIVPLYYSMFFGLTVCGTFLMATMITPGIISSYYNLAPNLISAGRPADINYFLEYYITPYCRMGPYIIGILAGYFLYRTELRIKWSKLVVIIGWTVSIILGLAVVYGLYNSNHNSEPVSKELASLYNAVSRTVWGLCIAWVIIACMSGYGGPVNVVLSWRALAPLSRLTYCAYLIHPIIMYAFYFGQKKALHFTNSMAVFLFFGFLVASYMLAFVVSLIFESPMVGLEKAILRRNSRK